MDTSLLVRRLPLVAGVLLVIALSALWVLPVPSAPAPSSAPAASGTPSPAPSDPPASSDPGPSGEAAATGSPASSRAPASSAAQDPAAVVDVRPLPGSVVDVADADLRALVAGDQPPTATAVRVDGVEVAHTTETTSAGVQVRAPLDDLAEGDRRLEVTVTTSDGETTRAWPVTATSRSRSRLAGADRFATAVAVSADVHADGSAPAAVVARADDFADALAGGPLAAHLGGPLLLTAPGELPAATARELERVLAADAPVHVLGGRVAVSRDVTDAIEARGHPVVRHAGPDRYATAAVVAAALPPSDTAVVAAGTRFPDALAASVPAAREGWPVLLTGTTALPAATRDALDGLDRAVVVGGEVAVSAGVEDAIADRVGQVERVAGPTRYATAVAVADRFLPRADEVALASGRDYPDALGAATRAAGRGSPLLLVEPALLPPETDAALRRARPGHVVVHGGPVAVGRDVAAAAHHAVVDGPDAPRVTGTAPSSGEASPTLAPVVVDLDRPVTAGSLVASVTLDGVELPTDVRVDESGTRVVVDPLSPGDLPLDEPRAVHVVLRATTADGASVHHAHRFVLREDDGVFATAGTLELVAPSAAVELVGYHQSNHEGAQQMTATEHGPSWVTLAHRGRRTGTRTAADIVADEHVPVVAPVTGTVLRAGTYVLYCDHTDHYLAIEPDGMPGIEVKLLHFRGLRVGSGDRVVAGETMLGDGPRRLPFSSQVDEYSRTGHGPHVHLEVVDTSIPNVPNSGSGSEDC